MPEGEWKIYVNGSKAGTESLGEAAGTVNVEPISAMILAKGVPENSDAESGSDDVDGNADEVGNRGTASGTDTEDTSGKTGILNASIILLIAALSSVTIVICKKKKK